MYFKTEHNYYNLKLQPHYDIITEISLHRRRCRCHRHQHHHQYSHQQQQQLLPIRLFGLFIQN